MTDRVQRIAVIDDPSARDKVAEAFAATRKLLSGKVPASAQLTGAALVITTGAHCLQQLKDLRQGSHTDVLQVCDEFGDR